MPRGPRLRSISGGASCTAISTTYLLGGTTSILLFIASSQGRNQDLQKARAIPLPLTPPISPTCSTGTARKALITLSLRAVVSPPRYISHFVIKPGPCSVHLSWHHHRYRHNPIPPKKLHACQIVLVDLALPGHGSCPRCCGCPTDQDAAFPAIKPSVFLLPDASNKANSLAAIEPGSLRASVLHYTSPSEVCVSKSNLLYYKRP